MLVTTGGAAAPTRTGAGERLRRRLDRLRARDAAQRIRWWSATATTAPSPGRWRTACRSLVSPAMADDAEHGARVGWAGAGLMVPDALLASRVVADRVTATAARRPGFGPRAREIAALGRARTTAPPRGATWSRGTRRVSGAGSECWSPPGLAEGHAFPALALSRELSPSAATSVQRRARRSAGASRSASSVPGSSPAREYDRLPGGRARRRGRADRWSTPRASCVRVIEELGADVVVGDLGTPAPALAAELAGVRSATLIPTLYPDPGRGAAAVRRSGCVAPRTPLGSCDVARGRAGARPTAADRALAAPRAGPARRRRGRELGLAPLRRDTRRSPPTGRSATAWRWSRPSPSSSTRGVARGSRTSPGRCCSSSPTPGSSCRAGSDPLVLIASSTGQDPARDLVRTRSERSRLSRCRVAATSIAAARVWSGSGAAERDRRRLVLLRQADAEGGARDHHRRATARSPGRSPTACRCWSAPAGADTAENGARVTWAGAGLMLPPRLLGASTLRRAVRRLLADPRFARRAREIGGAR